MDAEFLSLDHSIDQTVGSGQTVCLGEDLDPTSPVRRLRIRTPADRSLAIAERRRVPDLAGPPQGLERAGHLQHRLTRAREIEVEQADRFLLSPDDVPRTEVAVTDH